MSRGFRDSDSTQMLSEQATAGAIRDVVERSREDALRAAERRAEGVYGACEDCGGEIGAERLAVLPAATRCVRCQAASESR